MSGTVVVLGLLLTIANPSPDLLVSRLGAPRYADREAAAQSLEKLGRESLPALKRAKTHRDTEIRTRAEALLVKIEGRLLLEPSKIQLDFHDTPLPDVVSNINSKTGVLLSLQPEDRGKPPGRRVTLTAPEPLPFWTAVDRLCDVGSLQYSTTGRQTSGIADRSLQLSSGNARAPGMVCDSGPFRFNLLSLHYQRDMTFGNPPVMNMNPAMRMPIPGQEPQLASEQFYLRLQVVAEPSLFISQNRPAKVLTAVDDLGQSLVIPTTIESSQFQGDFFAAASGHVPFQIHLKRPARTGKVIRELRGVMPLNICARKIDRLEINLTEATGKTFKNDTARVTIHELKPHPNTNMPTIELSFATIGIRNEQPVDNDPFMMARPEIGPMNIELLNADDSPVSWYLAGTMQNGEDTRVSLALVPGPTGAPPKPVKLRYYSLIRTTSDIPFEFKDVPML